MGTDRLRELDGPGRPEVVDVHVPPTRADHIGPKTSCENVAEALVETVGLRKPPGLVPG
jgi:hypothetical protein